LIGAFPLIETGDPLASGSYYTGLSHVADIRGNPYREYLNRDFSHI